MLLTTSILAAVWLAKLKLNKPQIGAHFIAGIQRVTPQEFKKQSDTYTKIEVQKLLQSQTFKEQYPVLRERRLNQSVFTQLRAGRMDDSSLFE